MGYEANSKEMLCHRPGIDAPGPLETIPVTWNGRVYSISGRFRGNRLTEIKLSAKVIGPVAERHVRHVTPHQRCF